MFANFRWDEIGLTEWEFVQLSIQKTWCISSLTEALHYRRQHLSVYSYIRFILKWFNITLESHHLKIWFSVLDLWRMDVNVFYLENVSINHAAFFNDSRNITLLPYYQHSLAVATLFILAYVLIFSLCMVGNILVCFIVLKNRQMRTVTNIFILNLAISDVLVGIFCLPITLVDNLITGESSHRWPSTRVALKCMYTWYRVLTHMKCFVTSIILFLLISG